MGIAIGSQEPVGVLPSVGSHAGSRALDHGAIGAAGGAVLGLGAGAVVAVAKKAPLIAPVLMVAGGVLGGVTTGAIGASAALGQSTLQPVNERQAAIGAGAGSLAFGAAAGAFATMGTNRYASAIGIVAGAAAGVGIDVGLRQLEQRGMSATDRLPGA